VAREGQGLVTDLADADLFGALSPGRQLSEPPSNSLVALAVDEHVQRSGLRVHRQINRGAVRAREHRHEVAGAPVAVLAADAQEAARPAWRVVGSELDEAAIGEHGHRHDEAADALDGIDVPHLLVAGRRQGDVVRRVDRLTLHVGLILHGGPGSQHGHVLIIV
jgi:hypothetical protein